MEKEGYVCVIVRAVSEGANGGNNKTRAGGTDKSRARSKNTWKPRVLLR